MKITKLATLPQSMVVDEQGAYNLLCVEDGETKTFLVEITDNGQRIDPWYFAKGSRDDNYKRYCELANQPRYQVVTPHEIEGGATLLSFLEAVKTGTADKHPLRYGAEIPGFIEPKE